MGEEVCSTAVPDKHKKTKQFVLITQLCQVGVITALIANELDNAGYALYDDDCFHCATVYCTVWSEQNLSHELIWSFWALAILLRGFRPCDLTH